MDLFAREEINFHLPERTGTCGEFADDLHTACDHFFFTIQISTCLFTYFVKHKQHRL
jgi:hypothetical protein